MFTRWMLPVSIRVYRFLLAYILLLSFGFSSELKVRVRLADGQVAEETLEANIERDTITLEFKQGDGTLVTFVADFKQDVKIFRSLILGEPERGQSQYQALCFVTRLNRNELISSESMARLRQKNPHVIRSAEEKRTVEHLTMNVAVNLSGTWQLSAHIHNVCGEASEAIYTRQADAKYWLDQGVEGTTFEILPQTVDVPSLQDCRSTRELWEPCSCSYSLRLEWYPCLLKYCRGRDPSGKASPYKCGIKSCSKGYRFSYYVRYRQLCLWDDET